jgi:AcrR family transcriptional regulator
MEEELKNKIRKEALRMFMSLGVRSVTMDDVSRELAISKKTLYQFVSNKAELVHESFQFLMEQVIPQVRKIRSQEGNAIDHMFMLDDFMCTMVESHNPATKFQLQRYYPATWKSMDDTRFKEFMDTIQNNLERGIEEGLYRKNINTKLIAYMYYGKAEIMTDTQWFPTEDYDMTLISHVSLEYHLRGICSPKGLAYLDKLILDKKWKH